MHGSSQGKCHSQGPPHFLTYSYEVVSGILDGSRIEPLYSFQKYRRFYERSKWVKGVPGGFEGGEADALRTDHNG